MSESPSSYGTAPTVRELAIECHDLIEQVARRPGAAKLLMGVRNQLLMFSQYKANRSTSDRLARPP